MVEAENRRTEMLEKINKDFQKGIRDSAHAGTLTAILESIAYDL